MLTPYRPSTERPWNLRRVMHLHRRVGFSPSWDTIQRDLREGPAAAMQRLLRPDAGNTDSKRFEELSRVICEAAVESGNLQRLQAWWLYRMLYSPDSLRERLTLMWHNHFATSNDKVADVGLMRRQNDVFRALACGPFGELLFASLHEPALLIWLDADANRCQHPNENLAREVMELFALGVGNYTEMDVKEVARALTGWTVHRGQFRFQDTFHDVDEKVIFGQLGKWTGDDVVRLLMEHRATPTRIASRLCELMMGENCSPEVVAAVAAELQTHKLNVGPVIETLLHSEAFFADENIGNRVVGPVELIVGVIHALELTTPPPKTLRLAKAAGDLGQNLFAPPNVFGWPGGRSWLTSRTLIARANFMHTLLSGELHSVAAVFDAAKFAAAHGIEGEQETGDFYAQLLLGQTQVPESLQPLVDEPDRLVLEILSSPEFQLG